MTPSKLGSPRFYFILSIVWMTWGFTCHAQNEETPPPGPVKTASSSAAANRYLITQAERDREIIERCTGDPEWLAKTGNIWKYWVAQWYFKAGRVEEGLKIVRKGADGIQDPPKPPRKVYHKGFFPMWGLLDCFLQFQDLMDPETKAVIKKVYTENDGVPLYKGSTSNLSMLASTHLHLVAKTWGLESLSPYVQKDVNPKDPDRTKFLTERILHIARYGSGEFGSRPYSAYNLLPLLTLAKYASPELRQKALLAYEISLAHSAPTWLRGHWAVASGRSYPEPFGQHPATNIGHLWYYFGGLPPTVNLNSSIVAMTADYRPPQMIVNAAVDRSKPYVVRSRFDGATRFQTTFMNRRYALFSNTENGRHNIFGQCYPYGVMWDEPDPAKGSFLWVTVPSNDGIPLTDHAHGVEDHYIQYLQHEGTLLMVVDGLDQERRAHKGCWHPYVLCHIPAGYKALIDESQTQGRIFFHYNNVMIAINSTGKFEWNPKPGTASDPRSPDSEFHIRGINLAIGLETALPEDYPGATAGAQLKAFHDDVAAKSKVKCVAEPGSPAVAFYTDRNGSNLERPYTGMGINTSKINGKPLDFDHWPLIDSPWVHQNWEGDTLTVTDGKTVRNYDLKNWKITETGK